MGSVYMTRADRQIQGAKQYVGWRRLCQSGCSIKLGSNTSASRTIDNSKAIGKPAYSRQCQARINFQQWKQNERPLGQARVRNLKAVLIKHFIAVREQVKVEYTRSPALRIANPACLAFDGQQFIEQLPWG